MSVSDFAIARSIKQAAVYFDAAKELDAGYYSKNDVLRMHADFQPSAAYNAAAVAFAFAISEGIREALESDDDEDHGDAHAWGQAVGTGMAKSGWWHRVANVAIHARRVNDDGRADDNEWNLVLLAIRDQLLRNGVQV